MSKFYYLIFIFLFSMSNFLFAKTNYYKVRYGDTLSKIAHRYKTTTRKIMRANAIKKSRFVRTGRVLKVPSNVNNGYRTKVKYRSRRARRNKYKNRKSSYRVRYGDTLSGIAGKFGVSTFALARWNHMRTNSVLRTGKLLKLFNRIRRRKYNLSPREHSTWKHGIGDSQILTPDKYMLPKIKTKLFKERNYILKIYAHKFARGYVAYLELTPTKNYRITDYRLELDDKEVPLTQKEWGVRGIIAFDAKRKNSLVKLKLSVNQISKVYSLRILKTWYPQRTWRRYLGNYGYDKHKKKKKKVSSAILAKRKAYWKKRKEYLKHCREKKNQVFSLRTEDLLDMRSAHPRGYHRVTSGFFTERKIISWYYKNGKRHYPKPTKYRHRGLDLAGHYGKPIFALAKGRIVLSEKMPLEGNFTVINHGNGIFSGYMHQSKFIKTEGALVEAGKVIGEVGSTGASTGSHLHLSLWVRGKVVYPLSILGLPIR